MRFLFWRLILLSPLLVLLVLFALSNTEAARLTLWPTALLVEAPLSLLMLMAMGLAFLLGALATWMAGLGARMRARRAEREAASLRADLEAVRARLARAERPQTGTMQTGTILPPTMTPALPSPT